MVRGIGDGVELGIRSLALPWFFGLRWWSQARPCREEIPHPGLSLGLAAKVAADEFFVATEVVTAHFAALREPARIAGEIRAGLRLFRSRGWLANPARYHRTPRPLAPLELRPARAKGLAYDHLSFESDYAPHPGEPGRERWLGYAPNRTAHAWLLRHAGRERPWVVCVPGYRMGNPTVDFTGFQASWLHDGLGLNVAIPVLPFHGPRRVGRRGGDGFLGGDFLDTVHAQSQAVSDTRQLVRWLRDRGAPDVGIYGVSLGGYTAALLAALESNLACVVAGIPAACFVGLARWNAPALLLRAAERFGLAWQELEQLLRVISPLALPPRVPRRRRFLFAAMADRLAPPQQARELWRHWGRPRLEWYRGSHVSFLIEPDVRALLQEAFRATGMLGTRRARPRRASRVPPRRPHAPAPRRRPAVC